MRHKPLAGLALIALAGLGILSGTAAAAPAAPAPAAPPPPAAPSRVLATVGDVALVALDAPGFDRLTREQRLLAYWLSQAGQSGAAIAYDQAYRHNVPLVRLLRGILTHPQAVPPAVLPRVKAYAREIYLHHGLHDPETERKTPPPFSSAELRSAALAAQAAGADFGLPKGVSLESFLRALDGPLFEPAVDPLRIDPQPGRDPLLSSATNLYQGVSLADLAGFHERAAANSRLVKDGGRLIEQLQRAGQGAVRDGSHREPEVPPGLSAERLAQAVGALEHAARFANGPQLLGLRALQTYLRTGDAERFAAAERWSAQEAEPVELVAGFLDTSADPRGRKGLWEAFVGLADPAASAWVHKLAAAAPQLQSALPWPTGHRAAARPAVAEAVFALSASGSSRPLPFEAVHVPSPGGPQDAGKSLLLREDDELAARGARIARALAPPDSAAEVARCRAQDVSLFLALRELVGRAALPAEAPAEPLHRPALDEARAEAAAHFLLGSPEVAKLGVLPDPRCQAVWPQAAAVEWLAALAEVPQGDRATAAQVRARQLEAFWFSSKGAVAQKTLGGKRYLVADPARFRAAAGELWAQLTDLEARGDQARAAELLAAHASRIDTGLRDEVLSRLRALGLPRRTIGLPPSIEPVLADGKVVDASLVPARDLDARILADWASF